MGIFFIFLINITPLSYWTAGYSRDVEKRDTLLYLLSGGTTFIFNVSSSSLLRIGKEIPNPGTAYDIDFKGDTAFICGEFGIKAYDFQNPLSPQLIGEYKNKVISSFAIVSPYAYGVSEGKIIIFNLSTANIPESTSYYVLPGFVTYVETYGSIGFALAQDTLYILNLQDPLNPLIYSKLKTSGYFEDINKRNDTLYVVSGDSVKVYSITDPSSPSLITGFQVLGYAKNIEISGDTAIVALSFSGLATYQISTGLEIVHNYSFSNCILTIKESSGPYIYAVDLDKGIFILSYPLLSFIDSFITPEITYNSETMIGDSILVVSSGKGGIFFLDIKNKNNPYLINSINTPGTVFDVEIYQDTVLFVADGNEGIRIYNIRDLSSPFEYNYLVVNGYPQALSLNFPYLYTANGPGYGFSIIEVDTLSKPREIVNYVTSGNSQDVLFVPPNYLIIADGYEGVKIFDVADTANIQLISSLTTYGSSRSIKLNGNILAVAEGYGGGVSLWDLTTITSPSFYSNLPTPGYAMDVEFISPDTLIVADGPDYGLRKINISDPSNPSEEEYYLTPGEARGVFYSNGVLYASLGSLGIGILNPHITQIKEISLFEKKKKIKRLSLFYSPKLNIKNQTFYSINGRKTDKLKSGIFFIKGKNTDYKIILIK